MFADIENYYEHLVFEKIIKSLTGDSRAHDTAYLEDIACVALNRLPPRYARHSVDLASYLTDEEWETINRQVAEAVEHAIQFTRRRAEQRSLDLT